jgi:hypothetical protein
MQQANGLLHFFNMKRAFCILFLFINLNAFGQQNLIPNSSFNLTNVPTSINGVNCELGPFVEYIRPWSQIHTPSGIQIYDSCAFFTNLRVPYTNNGYQEPHSGTSFIVMVSYDRLMLSFEKRRSYIFCPLQSQLKKNRIYCFEMFLNLTDSSNFTCNNFGAYFSKDSLTYDSINFVTQNIFPQIENDAINNQLTSYIEWMSIKGSFVANGNEKYLTIGNFKSQINPDTVALPRVSDYRDTGFFLDDVSLVELKALNQEQDTLLVCAGESKTLSVFPDITNILWSSGDTLTNINVNAAGKYWVRGTNQCGTVADTFWVKILPQEQYNFSLGNDVFQCDSINTTLSISNPFLNDYLWSTGDTTQTISVNQAGTIWASSNSQCGLRTDTISLFVFPQAQVNLGQDTSLCLGQTLNLNAGNFKSYNWNTQDTTASIVAKQSNTYFVQVQDNNNCTTKDSITVTFEQATYNFLTQDTAVYKWQLPISVSVPQDFTNILWLDGSNQQSTQITNAGIFSVVAKDAQGCNVADSIAVTLKRQQIILPTINTLGQTFIIKNLPPTNVLRIYDGLGKLIYYEQNYTNNKQLVLSNAIYFISLEYKNDNNEQEVLVGKLLGME